MIVQITLTSVGDDIGDNLNITADIGSVTPSTASKENLLLGTLVEVDDLATTITLTSKDFAQILVQV